MHATYELNTYGKVAFLSLSDTWKKGGRSLPLSVYCNSDFASDFGIKPPHVYIRYIQ